jgi:PAS domain S-box-containing protein
LSPIGAAMETLDGHYLRVNDMLCQITGYAREELLGRHFADITHPADRENDLSNTQLVVTGKLAEHMTEKRYIRKDGQIAWVQLSVRLMSEGAEQPAYILATMVDITARKQLENALQMSRAMLRSIIDNAPLQISARDLEGQFTLVNKSFWESVGLARPQDALDKRIEDFFAPSECESVYVSDRQVLASGQPLTREIVVHSNGRSHTWLSTKFPIHDSAGAVTAIGVIAQDITERKEIEQALEQANVVLFQRIAELSALNHIAEALTQWTELPAALRAVGATLAGLFDQASFAVWLRDETGAMLSRVAIVAGDQTTMGGPIVALADDPVAAYVLTGGLPKVLAPASRLPLVARPPQLPADGRAGGCMVLPLLSGGGAIGLLCIRAAPPERMYTPADVALAQTIASTLASAIENARLFAAEQRQRRAAESLREVTTILTGSLDLETVVRTIFEQLGRVVRYDGAAIFLADGDALVLWKSAGIGETHIGHRIPLSETDPTVDVFLNRRPRIIDDTRTCADWIDWDGWDISLSYMGAPLVIGGTTIGALTTDHVATHIYGAEDLRTLEAFAHQAAIAIENARLFAQAQAAAAEDERKRLARELHDSVSQALFLANLNADVLPQLWDLDPTKGRRVLDDLQQFTRSALAEMRMLLIELRPDALVRTPLHELLQTLGSAVSAKHTLAVDAQLDAVPVLPEEVQIALYRITQEALNNVVKHAQARRVTLLLQITPPPAASERGERWCGQVMLRIVDDGRGFEVARAAKGGLGLGGMRERAGSIGASLEINSEPGAGTCVVATWRGSAAAAKEQV